MTDDCERMERQLIEEKGFIELAVYNGFEYNVQNSPR